MLTPCGVAAAPVHNGWFDEGMGDGVNVVDGTAFAGFNWLFVVLALRLFHLETAKIIATRHASPANATATIAPEPRRALYMPGKALEENVEYHSPSTTGVA